MTMRLSGNVTEIWRLKDNGVTSLTFWGSRDVFGHVIIRLPGVNFIWVVHGDHADAQLWRYSASDIGRTDLDTDRKTKEWKEKEEKGGEGKGKGKWKRKRKGKKGEKEWKK